MLRDRTPTSKRRRPIRISCRHTHTVLFYNIGRFPICVHAIETVDNEHVRLSYFAVINIKCNFVNAPYVDV